MHREDLQELYVISQIWRSIKIFPDKELDPKPDHDDDLQVVEHLPSLLLMLLDGGKHYSEGHLKFW